MDIDGKIMMKTLKYTLACMFIALSTCMTSYAQERISEGLEIDKTVHNFGDIMLDSGPVSCTFTLKNTGSKPAVIYNVTTTCGCTDVEWTREPIRPGGSGKIAVTYSNDEGPYPFDKSLTVYLSDVKKPVLLKLRGVCMEKQKPLTELYPVSFGPFALKNDLNKCGNLEQGGQKSEAVMVANTSDKPIKVVFKEVSENLKISVSPNPIPAGSTAEMSFTVTAAPEIWGKNTYWATPVVDGRTYQGSNGNNRIGVWAFTKENFTGISDDQKSKGPRPAFETSTWSFGKIRKGETVHAEFTFRNQGKETFKVHKVDVDACCYSHSFIPDAKPGENVTFRVHLDTKDMPAGETLAIVTLTTNSPLRPIVNLFIAGWLE